MDVDIAAPTVLPFSPPTTGLAKLDLSPTQLDTIKKNISNVCKGFQQRLDGIDAAGDDSARRSVFSNIVLALLCALAAMDTRVSFVNPMMAPDILKASNPDELKQWKTLAWKGIKGVEICLGTIRDIWRRPWRVSSVSIDDTSTR